MIFFLICRSIFLFFNTDELGGISFGEIITVYWNALYLDTSMTCYVLIFSFIIFVINGFAPKKIFNRIHSLYVLLLLILFLLITIAELEIYNEWGTKLNVKAILFLEHPTEVIGSARTSFLIIGIVGVAILVIVSKFLYRKISRFPVTKERRGVVLFFLPIVPVLLALGIRGGIQPVPIQQSDAYFSKHNILNLAAVNSYWNLVHSIIENKKVMNSNPFQFYPFKEAKKTVDEIYKTEKDTTIRILNAEKPNVVLVILESWSADLIKSLGGYDSITTNFEKLIAEGILFENCYASGSLSDQGMAAIFSGFPAQPSVSVIAQPSKYVHLPCITTDFDSAGYSTSFLFGGQLSYGNIRAYMYYNKFDRILEEKDFGDDIPRGKLGAHDEYLYEKQLQELRNEHQPFFASMFTMSSHGPFEKPEEKIKYEWAGDENNYVNSMRYADSTLFDFIEKAKKEKWFDNTLFIFISDHGHRSPKHYSLNHPEYRKIPLLFWGNAIKDEYKGNRQQKICSQIDIASTLLQQIGLPSSKYKWSKNIFNPSSPEFAYYEIIDGFGWVRLSQHIVYSSPMNHYYFEQTNSPAEKARLEKEGKSFLQVMFQEYTDY